VEIEASGGEVVAGAGGRVNAPDLAVELAERAAGGEARQLFEEQTAFPAAAEAQFAHQLLVSGLAAGRAGNPRHEFTIRHRSRVGHSSRSGEGVAC